MDTGDAEIVGRLGSRERRLDGGRYRPSRVCRVDSPDHRELP